MGEPAIRQSTAEELLRETNCLISLPEICLKLREILGDLEHSRNDISNLIMHDPALTSRLLRIVNSAYYGRSNPINDISHALGILGEYELNNLVVVTSIVETMNSVETIMDLNLFWRCSIYRAVLCRNLCKRYSPAKKEEMFIAGLLMNIGKFLIYYKEPDLQEIIENIMKSEALTDYQAEQKVLGFNHAEVGSVMAREWNFSSLLVDIIRQHHEIFSDNDDPLLNEIGFIAGESSDEIDFMQNSLDRKNTDVIELMTESLTELGTEKDAIQGIIEESFEDYHHVFEAFCGAAN